MHKIQITLTPEEIQLLNLKARQFGYNVTRFIKLLIGKEVLSISEKFPTIQLSAKSIKKIEKAMSEHVQGKSRKLEEIEEP